MSKKEEKKIPLKNIVILSINSKILCFEEKFMIFLKKIKRKGSRRENNKIIFGSKELFKEVLISSS